MTNLKNTVVAFRITRLNCSEGIFKLSGYWQPDRANSAKIEVQQLHIMGSDGWEELDLRAQNTKRLLQKLLPEIQHHLAHRYTF